MTRQTLLLTRPVDSAARFVARLRSDVVQDVRVVRSPLMRIVPQGGAPDLVGMAGVVFTSRNAVDLAPPGDGRPAWCVGDATAMQAREAGWQVRSVAPTADDLVAGMSDSLVPGPLIHLAGQHRRGDIATRLTAKGIPTGVHVLYDQQLCDLTDEAQAVLAGDGPVLVPLFSPRSARQFVDRARRLRHVTVVAMSDAVAQALGNPLETSIVIAKTPTASEMVRCVENLLQSPSVP